MSDTIEAQLRSAIAAVKPIPEIVHMILEKTNDADSSMDDIVFILNHEPVLSAKLIKLANSPFYATLSKVTSVKHASVVLGISTIRNLTLSCSLMSESESTDEIILSMWLDAITKAVVSSSLAERDKKMKPDDAFIYGLLSNLGKLVFLEAFPQEYTELLHVSGYQQGELTTKEKAAYAIDNLHLITRVCEYMKLPQQLYECFDEQFMESDEYPLREYFDIATLLSSIHKLQSFQQPTISLAQITHMLDAINPHSELTKMFVELRAIIYEMARYMGLSITTPSPPVRHVGLAIKHPALEFVFACLLHDSGYQKIDKQFLQQQPKNVNAVIATEPLSDFLSAFLMKHKIAVIDYSESEFITNDQIQIDMLREQINQDIKKHAQRK